MPNRKNAIVQLRKVEKRTERNKNVKSTLKTARKIFDKIVDEKKKETVNDELKKIVSVIDKTVKKGVIPKGRANRLKSRAALRANKISAS